MTPSADAAGGRCRAQEGAADADVQHAACEALAALCDDAPLAQRIVARGAMEAVMFNSLAGHKGDASVAKARGAPRAPPCLSKKNHLITKSPNQSFSCSNPAGKLSGA